MNVSSIQTNNNNLRRNLFIKYANSFMSNPDENILSASEKAINANPTDEGSVNKSKGIETLTALSIFPKQVINGHTVITA